MGSEMEGLALSRHPLLPHTGIPGALASLSLPEPQSPLPGTGPGLT